MATQRDGFITGLEGTAIALSSNLGKIRTFTTGPATEGIQGLVPGEPVIAEVVNRSLKRLVFNDYSQFFKQVRNFSIEKNGDNRYSFFSYDFPEPGSVQIQPVIVSFIKPFSSLVDSVNGIGAVNTFIELANYLPDSINVWGVSNTGYNLDSNYGNNGCLSFTLNMGTSSLDDPFAEGTISDTNINTSTFGTAVPTLTIKGNGTKSTYVSNLSVELSKGMSLELKDLTVTSVFSLTASSGSVHFDNVLLKNGITTASEEHLSKCTGTLVVEHGTTTSVDTLNLSRLGATKLTSRSNKTGFGFYRYSSTYNKFQEVAFLGDSTVDDSYSLPGYGLLALA